MKNDLIFKNKKCFSCNVSGFFVEYPNGADYTACPNCNNDVHHQFYDKINRNYNELNELSNIIGDSFNYCKNCNIIFSSSHTHYNGGCTDVVDNTLFITRYMIDDKIYENIPVFDNYDECKKIFKSKKFKILDLSCTCNNNLYCNRPHYYEFKIIKEIKDCKLTMQYKLNCIVKIQKWYRNLYKK